MHNYHGRSCVYYMNHSGLKETGDGMNWRVAVTARQDGSWGLIIISGFITLIINFNYN